MNRQGREVNLERKVDVVEDLDGKKTVFIHDILFKGKRTINWGEVERYLKRYVGEIYTVAASNDVVYIGPDLPDEYAHSNYTHILRGTNAKAKANAVQGLPELMEVANGKSYTENYKTKSRSRQRSRKRSACRSFFARSVSVIRKRLRRWHTRKLRKFIKIQRQSASIIWQH